MVNAGIATTEGEMSASMVTDVMVTPTTFILATTSVAAMATGGAAPIHDLVRILGGAAALTAITIAQVRTFSSSPSQHSFQLRTNLIEIRRRERGGSPWMTTEAMIVSFLEFNESPCLRSPSMPMQSYQDL